MIQIKHSNHATPGEKALAVALPVLIFNRLEDRHGRTITSRVKSWRQSVRPSPTHVYDNALSSQLVEADGERVSLMAYSLVDTPLVDLEYELCRICGGRSRSIKESLQVAHRFAAREAGRLKQVEAFTDYYLNEVGGDLMNTFLE